MWKSLLDLVWNADIALCGVAYSPIQLGFTSRLWCSSCGTSFAVLYAVCFSAVHSTVCLSHAPHPQTSYFTISTTDGGNYLPISFFPRQEQRFFLILYFKAPHCLLFYFLIVFFKHNVGHISSERSFHWRLGIIAAWRRESRTCSFPLSLLKEVFLCKGWFISTR